MPKKLSVLAARNGLGSFGDGGEGYITAIVAADIGGGYWDGLQYWRQLL
jgi:hypothetical protein